ncbi:MAG TPA: DUF58 domain-containing protein [Thermoflexales bacterium]|nr:DUF58 domain-containing protein [Thermoflexales bacterium]
MLSESFLKSLVGLRLASTRRQRGALMGERRSARRGRSIEFADYRNYTPGDDPRRVDWNIYARHEKAYIKLFEDEEDTAVSILLDVSKSMRWMAEDETAPQKMERAAEIALSLAFIALSGGDRLVMELSNGARIGPRRGAGAMAHFASAVSRELARADATSMPINTWLRRYAATSPPGMCFVVSDLLDETGYQDGLNVLATSRAEVSVVQTLCPDELAPRFEGDVRLKDVETGAARDLSMDNATLRDYAQRLKIFTDEAQAFCQRRGGRYFLADTSQSTGDIVARDLRRQGWIV